MVGLALDDSEVELEALADGEPVALGDPVAEGDMDPELVAVTVAVSEAAPEPVAEGVAPPLPVSPADGAAESD